MQFANQAVVKITCGESLATGFINQPDDGVHIYIITCRHAVILEDNILHKDNINISFFDKDNATYQLTEADEVLTGANDEDEDYAVLILKKNNLARAVLEQSALLASLTGYEKECIVIGVPKAVNNEWVRSLNQVQLLPDRDFEIQLQLEVSDPVSKHHNSDDLVEGYSGSPIMVSGGDKLYAIGIFQKYEENSRRIIGIRFSPLNELLQERNYPLLHFFLIEPRTEVREDIKTLVLNTKRVLGRIKDQIGTLSLERADAVAQLSQVIVKNGLTLVHGVAGVGKSSVTKRVLNKLSAEFEIIALQGDQLDKRDVSLVFQEPTFNLSHEVEIVLNSPGLKAKKILLIDSIEKVLETDNAATINDFFEIVKHRQDLKIVLTCRNYALQQLEIRFLKQFPISAAYAVPILTDEELATVAVEYPAINSLIHHASLKSILKIPFNLDKATFIGEKIIAEGVPSEWKFKQIAWEYIVENRELETDATVRKERSDTLEKIIVERAKQMVSYVYLKNELPVPIVEKLIRDNIVEENPLVRYSYTASHDIYEDWALTRFIEHQYQSTLSRIDSPETFISRLDISPALRRAFRIWIAEKLQQIDEAFKAFLTHLLTSEKIASFWKDEVLIGIVQSSYSDEFLQRGKQLLVANDFTLFKRSILLLSVACQSPDLSLMNDFKENEKSHLYRSSFLKPFGEGWHNIIVFSYNHLLDLEPAFTTVLDLLSEWGKIIKPQSVLPVEARSAGLILIRYIYYYRERRLEENYISSEQVSIAIDILLKLVPVVKEEIRAIFSQAVADRENLPNHKMRGLYIQLFEKALAWPDSYLLCQELPELVIEIAKRAWCYFSSAPDEQSIEDEEYSHLGILGQQEGPSEKFGVVSDYGRDYFPASAYQTPVSFLLKFKPVKTVRFIIELLNHSVASFWHSDFLREDGIIGKADKRKVVSYILPDGTTVTQYGTLALWVMYRGGIYVTLPYLLQSVLMALEAWLLSLAEMIISRDREDSHLKTLFEYIIDCLLKESKTVSTTAVVVSVTLAYPNLMAKKVLPLLKVREFYEWDLGRKAHEHKAAGLFGAPYKTYAKLLQEERQTSNNLAHRKDFLETLVIKLSFSGYETEILSILDGFYAEHPTDNAWKIALNRMDRRKLKVTKVVKNGFEVLPQIDEDLQPIVAKTRVHVEEISRLNAAASWSLKMLDGKVEGNGTYEQWQALLPVVSAEEHTSDKSYLYNNPAALAAVGLQHFYVNLNEQELAWCLKKTFNILEHQLNHNNPYNTDFDSPFSAFEPDAAIVSLVEIIKRAPPGSEALSTAKQYLFGYLLFIQHKSELEKLIEKVRNELWDFDTAFTFSCVAGVLAYSKVSKVRWKISRLKDEVDSQPQADTTLSVEKIPFTRKIINWIKWLFGRRKEMISPVETAAMELQKLTGIYDDAVNAAFTGILNSDLQILPEDFFDSKWAPYFILLAVKLTPASISDMRIRALYKSVLVYVLENQGKKSRHGHDSVSHEDTAIFLNHLVAFLMCQPKEVSLDTFKVLTDSIFENDDKYQKKRVEIVKNVLESIITYTITNPSKTGNFWALWSYVSDKMLASGKDYVSDILLLDYSDWLPQEDDWELIRDKKHFFEPLIQKFGSIETTARLLSGVGSHELMPEGLIWLKAKVDRSEELTKEEIKYLERMVLNVFYRRALRKQVRERGKLKDAFIYLLERLIDNNIPSAFLIREDFVSMR